MKKSLKKLQEQLKAIQRQIKETEKEFYYTIGKEFESELKKETVTVERLREIYEQKKEEFGYASRV